MTTPNARWSLPTRHLGRDVHVFDEIASTNDYLLGHVADPARHGLVALARSQTAGRGQYGRTWSAPAGSSVLASALIFPPASLRRPVVLIAWAAVALCDVLRDVAGLDAVIKWPNDLLVAGKKVCGFLIEQRTTGLAEHPLATVVGFGLNALQPQADFDRAGLRDAGSIFSLSGKAPSVDDLTRAIVERLDDRYAALLDGGLGELEAQWQWRLNLVDRPAIVECVDGSVSGQLVDASFDALTLHADGALLRLAPESIRHLHPQSPPQAPGRKARE